MTDQEIFNAQQRIAALERKVADHCQAIKRYRELTGLGLAEATDAVRVLHREHGPIGDQQY